MTTTATNRWKWAMLLLASLLCACQPQGMVGIPQIATLPRTGVAGADKASKMALAGVQHGYHYYAYSNTQAITPMLKRRHIKMLRGEVAENCGGYSDCPSQGIPDTVAARGIGGYWLIFNEPGGEDGYSTEGSVYQAAHDACYAMQYIRRYDSQAKFIVGYYNGLEGTWGISRYASQYGLPSDLSQIIAGWHLHIYDGSLSIADFNAQLAMLKDKVLTFKRDVVDTVTPSAEIWLTEFGTLMRRRDGDTLWCDDLEQQAGCQCRFDHVDNNTVCIRYMQTLLGWLESAESPVTRYYWWNYGPPQPSHITEASWRRDVCYGSLTDVDGNLNALGRAFVAFGSTSPGPTATPTVATSPRVTATPTVTTSPRVTATPTATAVSPVDCQQCCQFCDCGAAPTATPQTPVSGPSCRPCESNSQCAVGERCYYCYGALGWRCVRISSPNGDCTKCRNRP